MRSPRPISSSIRNPGSRTRCGKCCFPSAVRTDELACFNALSRMCFLTQRDDRPLPHKTRVIAEIHAILVRRVTGNPAVRSTTAVATTAAAGKTGFLPLQRKREAANLTASFTLRLTRDRTLSQVVQACGAGPAAICKAVPHPGRRNDVNRSTNPKLLGAYCCRCAGCRTRNVGSI